jgi:hypothetical protein
MKDPSFIKMNKRSCWWHFFVRNYDCNMTGNYYICVISDDLSKKNLLP